MRFYNGQHRYYCGVDLHTKRMYLCISTRKATLGYIATCGPSHTYSAQPESESTKPEKTGLEPVRSLDSRGQIGVRHLRFESHACLASVGASSAIIAEARISKRAKKRLIARPVPVAPCRGTASVHRVPQPDRHENQCRCPSWRSADHAIRGRGGKPTAKLNSLRADGIPNRHSMKITINTYCKSINTY